MGREEKKNRDVVVHTCYFGLGERLRQEDCCELAASLIDLVCSRTAWATE